MEHSRRKHNKGISHNNNTFFEGSLHSNVTIFKKKSIPMNDISNL
jgi:hypothetical protein